LLIVATIRTYASSSNMSYYYYLRWTKTVGILVIFVQHTIVA